MARLLTLEQGKPLRTMATSEVDDAIFWVREVAKREIPVEVIEDTDQHLVEVRHTALGVVGAITPWNFPVLLGLWKIAPCLITGNTMVVKPSPYTPLCTLKFGEIAQQVFPAGVLNVVSGGNELGQQLTEHLDIAKISFTGSTATGKKVMASALHQPQTAHPGVRWQRRRDRTTRRRLEFPCPHPVLGGLREFRAMVYRDQAVVCARQFLR